MLRQCKMIWPSNDTKWGQQETPFKMQILVKRPFLFQVALFLLCIEGVILSFENAKMGEYASENPKTALCFGFGNYWQRVLVYGSFTHWWSKVFFHWTHDFITGMWPYLCNAKTHRSGYTAFELDVWSKRGTAVQFLHTLPHSLIQVSTTSNILIFILLHIHRWNATEMKMPFSGSLPLSSFGPSGSALPIRF